MMSNSNENQDGDAFKINEFYCNVAKLKHEKITIYRNENLSFDK